MGQEEVDFSNESTATQYLDKQGVDPKFYSEPFLEASELGDATSLRQRLAQVSADEKRQLVRSVDQHGCTGLLLSAKKGDYEMVDLLLEAGANARDTDTTGATALHFAAGRGGSSTMKSLLAFAADVDAKDERNETPLMWARGRNAASLLLEARADANARSTSGETALMIACRNGDEDCIQVLLDVPGLDLDACDTQGCSAYAAAMAAGHLDAAELLVSQGAKAQPSSTAASRIVRREEAFFEAARRGDAEAVTKFLHEGADVEMEVSGETALLVASGSACSRVVETLLENRADPNHADAFMGETPLIRAVLGQSTNEMLWMLLEAKADPSREDVGGRTPASVASAWGYSEAAEILKAAAAGELNFGTMD